MNIIHYSIRSFFTNEYYSIIRFASKRLFVATLLQVTSTRGRVRHWPVGGTGTQTLTWPRLVLARPYSSFRTIDQKISPQFLNIADQKTR